jgi:hypothetical protein
MSDIVKVDQNQSLATTPQGFEGLGPAKVANLVLVQNTSRDGTPGKFRDKLSGQEFDTLQVVLLGKTMARVYFPEGKLGADPLCRSNNGLVPISAELLGHPPLAMECGKYLPNGKYVPVCEHAVWSNYDRRTKTGKLPPCKEQAKLLLIERDTGLPYRLTLSKTSLKPLRDLIDTLQRDSLGAAARKEIRNIYDYTFTISSQKVVNSQGVFYTVTFGTPSVLKAEDRGMFGPMFVQFVQNQEIMEDEIEGVIQEHDEVNQELPEY